MFAAYVLGVFRVSGSRMLKLDRPFLHLLFTSMNIKSKLVAMAMGVCLTMASGSALAELVGEAHVGQIGWRLVDLDENDGITPGMDAFDWMGYHDSSFTIDGSTYWSDTKVAGIFEPLATHVRVDDTWLDTAQGGGGAHSLTRVNNAGRFAAYLTQQETFTLTPHTRIEYFGTYSIRAMGDGRELAGGNRAESELRSQVYADVHEYWPFVLQPENYFFKDAVVRGGVGASAFSGNFIVRFDNRTANAVTGVFNLRVVADGNTPVAQVPEPETYAMMLGGLALLGALARRRQRT